MWEYEIYNDIHNEHFAIIRHSLTGVRLALLYKDLGYFSIAKSTDIVSEITKQLNKDDE